MTGFKNLEAKAVITAVDGTGRVFAQIADKIAQVTRAANRASGGNFGAKMHNINLRKNPAVVRSDEMVAAEAALRRTQKVNIGSAWSHYGLGATMAAGGAAAVASRLGGAAGGVEHEKVRMEAAGMSKPDISQAINLSESLGKTFRTIPLAEILHTVRNARSIVGTFAEAGKVVDPLLKLMTVTQGAHPEKVQELAEEFDKLLKGMEIKGVTMDPKKFTSYMDGMAKAMNVFGDTLRPTDFYEMFKYGRQATTGLSQKYMLMTGPTLAQELGGSSAGKAQQAFFHAIIGGFMKNTAVMALDKMGLVDKSKIVRTKMGGIKNLMPGAIKGSSLATKNPYEWVNTILLPALKKNGYSSKEDINKFVATMFSNQSAAQMVSIFATQQKRIEKDHKLIAPAKGLSSASLFLDKDPSMAVNKLTTGITNLAAAAGKPFLNPAIAGIGLLSNALVALTRYMNKDPVDGAAGGIAAVGAGGAAAAMVGSGALGMVGIGGGAGAMGATLGATAWPVAIGAVGSYAIAKAVEEDRREARHPRRTKAGMDNLNYYLGGDGSLGIKQPLSSTTPARRTKAVMDNPNYYGGGDGSIGAVASYAMAKTQEEDRREMLHSRRTKAGMNNLNDYWGGEGSIGAVASYAIAKAQEDDRRGARHPRRTKANIDNPNYYWGSEGSPGIKQPLSSTTPAKLPDVHLAPDSKANVNIHLTVDVTPSGDLIKAVAAAKQSTVSSSGSVRANLTGAGSVGRSSAETGAQ